VIPPFCNLTYPDHPREQAPACGRRSWIGWLAAALRIRQHPIDNFRHKDKDRPKRDCK
jgi:hypothetical protein